MTFSGKLFFPSKVPEFLHVLLYYSSKPVVIGQHFKPRYCRVSVELGRGKSLICITVE